MTSYASDWYKRHVVPGTCPFSLPFMLHVGEVHRNWFLGSASYP